MNADIQSHIELPVPVAFTYRRRLAAVLVPILAIAALVGCAGSEEEGVSSSANATANPTAGAEPEVVAVVGDDSVTMTDVREELGGRLTSVENEYRRQRTTLVESAVRALVQERILEAEAERRGISVDSLLEEESETSLQVTQADVESWYQRNRPRLGGRSLDELEGQIRDRVRADRRSQAIDEVVDRLREDTDVKVFVEPYRVALDNEGAPARGPDDAPVTLVEFADFECPFCGRFYPTLKLLEQNYGDRLRVVYRHFPITSIHPNAWKAAVASECAREQGEFWGMHDLLFENQEALDSEPYARYASQLGLDQERFASCLAAEEHSDEIQADLDAGRSIGVTGTPALFVNGIQVPGGAVPYGTVADIVDRELMRAGE